VWAATYFGSCSSSVPRRVRDMCEIRGSRRLSPPLDDELSSGSNDRIRPLAAALGGRSARV